MMFNVAHIGFILASYAFAVAVIGGLIAAVVLEHRRLTRELSQFEPRREDERA